AGGGAAGRRGAVLRRGVSVPPAPRDAEPAWPDPGPAASRPEPMGPARSDSEPVALTRSWRPDFRLDLLGLLAPLRRGSGDPTLRIDGESGTCWRTSTTADGPATLALRRTSDGVVEATAWGPGAQRALDGLPAL